MKEIETIQDLASGVYEINLKNANLITGAIGDLKGTHYMTLPPRKADLEDLKYTQYISLT